MEKKESSENKDKCLRRKTSWVFKILWNLTVELLFTPQDVTLPSPFGKT